MRLKFIEVETTIEIKLCGVLEQLNQRHNQAERVIVFVDDCSIDSEEQNLSTQFLRMKRNHIFDLMQLFGRFSSVLRDFEVNSTKYKTILIKPFLLPILVNERSLDWQV